MLNNPKHILLSILLRLIFACFFIICSGVIAYGSSTINVPRDYSSIQDGIDHANEGDTILVASGIYYENINFSGKNIIVTSTSGSSKTVINGNQTGSVVYFWNKESNSAILEGFTITNGLFEDQLLFPWGGGISIRDSSPTIKNCIIDRNGAQNAGGIYISGHQASPVIEKNIVSNNIATELGGGIEIRDYASPTLKNNVIRSNIAMDGSGIMISNGAFPEIDGNTISGNVGGYDLDFQHAKQYLDGEDVTEGYDLCGEFFPKTILVADNCNPVITNNMISENTGGGISVVIDSSPIIKDNTIKNNLAATGLLVALGSTPVVTGNTITDNQGGAIWIDESSSLLDEEYHSISVEGFRFIEDTDSAIKFTGNWDRDIGDVYTGGTRMASVDNGATAQVGFIGTGITLLYFFKSDLGIVDICLDGIDYPSVDLFKGGRVEGLNELVIASNLALDNHTLTIKITDAQNPLSASIGLVLDAIGILYNGYLGSNTIQGSVYTWPPSSNSDASQPVLKNTWLVPGHHTTIQEAINISKNGDVIIVEPGIYRENINFNGKEIILKSKDPGSLRSVQTTVIEAVEEWPTVAFIKNETRNSILEGFTIINNKNRVAIQIYNSSPSIIGNIIQDSSWGGINCGYAHSPLIQDNVIKNNAADSGSGISCFLSSLEIDDNDIIDNIGAGISSFFSNLKIINNKISNNLAVRSMGTGIFLDHFSITSIADNTISNNGTPESGHGIGIYMDCFSNSEINRNFIQENYSAGLFMINDCRPVLTNNVIIGHPTAVHASLSRVTMTNNTVADNIHGLFITDTASVNVRNTIFWNDWDFTMEDYAGVTVDCCNIKSDWDGETNISADPVFAGDTDYHLSRTSSCIDKGTSQNAPDIDIEGVERPQKNGYDIGAYEYVCKINITGCSITGDINPNSPLSLKTTADNSCDESIYYRFSVHPDYGTSGYDGKHWSTMTATEWISQNSTDYIFTTLGKYIVVVWATSIDTQSVDPPGIPIIGWSVDVSQADCRTNFTGIEISGSHKVNTPISFTVTAQNSCSSQLYYRFSKHPDYGTSSYDGKNWQLMTDKEWQSSNSLDYKFTKAGKYIVVVWVSETNQNIDPTGIPIIGWSVDIE